MKKQSIRAVLLSSILLVSCFAGCAANMKDAAINGMAANEMYCPEKSYADVIEPEWNTEEYDYQEENSFQSVAVNPLPHSPRMWTQRLTPTSAGKL